MSVFVPNKSFVQGIAEGDYSQYGLLRKFGHSETLSTTEQLISFNSPTSIYLPTVAVTATLVSNSTNDNSAGSGARSITIFGLDGNWQLQSETVDLDGTNPVTTANQYLRIFRGYIEEVGTHGGVNIGNISCYNGVNFFFVLESGLGQTETSHYTVPAGYTLFVYDVHLNVEANKSLTVGFWQLENDVSSPTKYNSKRIVQHYNGLKDGQDYEYHECPFVFPERTDVWFTGQTSSGTADASVEWLTKLKQN